MNLEGLSPTYPTSALFSSQAKPVKAKEPAPTEIYSPGTTQSGETLNNLFAGKKVYYAHPITEYDTPVEAQIEQKFEQACPGIEVTNPNQSIHSEGYKKEGWQYFDRLVQAHDAVVFTCHSNGAIGAGVFKEVSALLERGCPGVFADPRHQDFVPIDKQGLSRFKVLDVPSTRALIQEERALKGSEADPFSTMAAFGVSVDKSGNLGFLDNV